MVGLASSVAERLVLHPAPHLVQAAVASEDHVERIRHPAGVIKIGRESRSEGLSQVGGHHLDAV